MPRLIVCCLSFVAALLTAVPAASQDTGEVTGTVTDLSGAVLPGVLVTLDGPVLLQPHAAVTGSTGTYRFPRLELGIYTVRFELSEFRTVVRDQIKIEAGFNATVNATLELSPLTETLTVRGVSPIIDLRDTSRASRFTREALDRVPTSRDPYSTIAQTPGVQMSDINVGGNLSGQQPLTASRGDWAWNNTWTLDGIDVTDVAAAGASSIYYDFDSFEEIQVTTGGSASQQTSGVGINLVTRSGTDVFRGSGRLLVTDDSLESQNVDGPLRQQGAGAGNPIQNIKDSGLEAGGPLKAGRAWIWGAYGRQDVAVGVINFYRKGNGCTGLTGQTALTFPLDTVRDCLQPDRTTLWSANLKANVQVAANNRMSWFTNFAEKTRPFRDASDLRPVETTVRQAGAPSTYGPRLWKTGPSSLWKIGDQHVFADRWLLDIQWAHQGSNFALNFQDPSLASEQPRFEIATRAWSRSYVRNVFLRPVDTLALATDYFRPSWAGGDHAVSAGWRRRSAQSYGESHWGANTVARYRNGVAAEADLYRDAKIHDRLDTQAAWVSDTFTRGHVAVTLGLRWDRQRDAAAGSSVPAHPFQGQMTAPGVPFNWLPAASFDGADAGPAWNNFAPRIGVTYDVSKDARTVLKASFARYYGQRPAGWLADVVNPASEAMIRFPWTDSNRDGYVQPNEVDTTRILAFSGSYNPYQPEQTTTANTVDPGIKNTTTDEIVLAVDRQIAAEFAIGAAYVWRRYADFSMNDIVGLTSADYARRSFTPSSAACPQPSARCESVEYWEPTMPLPSTVFMTNRPDYDRRYHGLEFVARRRLRDRWMLDASFTFNEARQYYRSPLAYEDPTNVDKLDGAQFGTDRTRAGNLPSTPVPNATWIGKVSGAYRLPWRDVAVAAFYQARQGYPFPQSVQTPARANGAGIVNVLLDPIGEVRYPALHLVDFGISKAFHVGLLTLTCTVDAFNLANANTVLARAVVQNAPNANDVSTIIAPRVIRLGVRTTW